MDGMGRGRVDVLIEVAGVLAVAALLVAVAVWTDDAVDFAKRNGLMPAMPLPTDRI